jgi:nucleotide-binding universal stress UspA family protein
MFKTLVVALDLEADGDRALPIVRALARSGTVDVDLVTVSSPGLPTAPDAYELARRAHQHGWDCDAWSIVHDIDAARGIVQHVAAAPDALLVMATTARRPWSPFGSVTHDVLRATSRPVLLIGPRVPWTYAPTCTTLVPCLDPADGIERAIPAIVCWQQTFTSASPQIAEVVGEFDDDAAAHGRVEAFAGRLAAQHVQAVTHVLHDDDPIYGLEQLSDQFIGPVYVATSARYTDGRLHWHSTTQALVHRANRPVLVVPALPSPVTFRPSDTTSEHIAFHDLTAPADVPMDDRLRATEVGA